MSVNSEPTRVWYVFVKKYGSINEAIRSRMKDKGKEAYAGHHLKRYVKM